MSVHNFSLDFRRLFELSPGAFLVLLPDLTIADATDEYLRTVMRRREDIVGREVFEAFPDNPDDEAINSVQIKASFLKVFETGESDELPLQKYDVQRPAEDGGGYEERYWRLVTFPGFDETGKVAYIYQRVENITEQIRAEKSRSEQESLNAALTVRAEKSEAALRDARVRLEAALNAGEIGTWTWDIKNDLVAADENLAKFFSVSKEDAQGGKIEKYLAAIHPEDTERVAKLIADVLENKDSYEAEYRLLKPDGFRWVVARGQVLRDENGKAYQLPGVAIDITERKKAEENLRESERRLKFALEAGRLGSYELDFATGNMLCSERCLANFGLPPDANLPFDKFLSMIHTDDRQRVENAVKYATENQTDYETEYRIIRGDGEAAWIFARGHCLYNEDGKPLVMNGVTLDITNRKKSEEELIESRQSLALALEAGRAGTFAWDIANNINIWSPELEAMYGVSTGTFEGDYNSWEKRVFPEDLERTNREIQNALEKGIEFLDYEFRVVLLGDELRWFFGRARFEYDEEKKPLRMVGINIDITESKKSQALLLERTKLASLTGEIGIALNRREDLESLLKHCTDAMVEYLDVAFARIWTIDESGETLELQASSGIYTHIDGGHARVPVGKFKIGRIAERRAPHLTNEVFKDEEIGDKDWARREKMVAFAGYPLIVGEKLVGVMAVFSRKILSETVIEAMETFANTIANAIERKQIEKNLRISNERFQLISRATNDTIWDWNLQTNEVWWNESVQTMFGYTPDEVASTSDWWYKHIHPEDRERVISGIHRVIDEGGEKWSDEYSFQCADGNYKHVFDRGSAIHRDGELVRMLGAMQDITARRTAEENFRKSQERLQLVIDSSTLGFWYCDLPFDVLDWSVLTKQHFWLPPDAVVTIKDFYNIIHPEDREKTRLAIDESIEKRGQYDVEYRTVNPSGDRLKWIRAIGRGFYDENNEPYRFDGITIDISEEKMIESERESILWREKDARAEAENANRMKDEFLATLSHELRTPLSSILGWSRMLKEGKLAAEQASRAIETIERNARSQSQLIEDVLDVSRIVSGKMRLEVRPINLTAVIEGAIDAVRPAAEAKGIRLQRVTDTDVMISGDADRLQQVIWNLLSNAIKFTPKAGRVQIKMERINSHVEITVADNGMGIEPETLPYVFDRFRQSDSTTTRKYGGLGLGLAIVRHLVELHGGTVLAASDGLNQGATFTLMFPLIALRSKDIQTISEEEINERIHPTAGGSVPFVCPDEIKNLRILVVDDEPDTRELLMFIFDSCEAHVKGASSVENALEIIQTEEFDVLVSDIGMPERDGYDLIRTVRKLPSGKNGRIPAVALTAYARVEDRLRALNSGFQMHVPKPVEPTELLAVVASLSNRNDRK